MTGEIKLPAAWDAFKAEANKKDATRNDQCWDVVGDPLNTPVRHVVAAYYEKLELGDKNIAMSKRGEILDLNWGRIEQDAAALRGLGFALEDLSKTIDTNVRLVSEHWSGESFDAFKTAMGKIRTTLDAYVVAAKKVGDILLEAMTQARSMYQDYATATQQTLGFKGMSPPEQWHRMDDRTGAHLRSKCVDGAIFCRKDDEAVAPILKGHFATSHQLAVCEAEPCDANLERVRIMYDNLVEAGKDGREKVRRIVRDWCGTTDDFKDSLESVLKIAVDNVHALAKSQAFSSLKIVGAAGGGQPTGGGDTGGFPGNGGAVEPIVDPTTAAAQPEPATEPAPEAAVAEPPAESTDPAADAGTVTINDGDRTIGVSDKGAGHVNVTVTDASGTTKTYDLDFDAASGLNRSTEGQPAVEGVEQVPARTNGKCVFQNGDVTITAERPLFAPDQITLTVDDGTGTPAQYTVDFPDTLDTGDAPAGTQPPATSGTGDATPDAIPDPTAAPATAAGSSADETGATPASSTDGGPAAGGSRVNQLTSPQAAWSENAHGSVSGVLSPERPGGDPVLAAAPDDPQHDASGMVGAGLPIMGHPGGGTGEGGRAGSGWSVHGDLFDSGEPVYSMHGVLGDDDFERTDG